MASQLDETAFQNGGSQGWDLFGKQSHSTVDLSVIDQSSTDRTESSVHRRTASFELRKQPMTSYMADHVW